MNRFLKTLKVLLIVLLLSSTALVFSSCGSGRKPTDTGSEGGPEEGPFPIPQTRLYVGATGTGGQIAQSARFKVYGINSSVQGRQAAGNLYRMTSVEIGLGRQILTDSSTP